MNQLLTNVMGNSVVDLDKAKVIINGEQEIDFGSQVLNEDAKKKLLGYIEEIERQEEAKSDISESIKDIFAAAKAEGFDTKAMRQIIRLRRKDQEERNDELSILDVYLHALEMI